MKLGTHVVLIKKIKKTVHKKKQYSNAEVSKKEDAALQEHFQTVVF